MARLYLYRIDDTVLTDSKCPKPQRCRPTESIGNVWLVILITHASNWYAFLKWVKWSIQSVNTSRCDCISFLQTNATNLTITVSDFCKVPVVSLQSLSLYVLTAIFQVDLGSPVFIEAKDDGGGGDNWITGAITRAKLQSNHHHQQTNIQFIFTGRMPFLSPNQQCQSTEGKLFHCSGR